MPPPKPTSSRKRKAPPIPKTKQPTILASIERSSSERSWVWDHVTKCTVSEIQAVEKDGKKEMVEVQLLKAKCNHCSALFACDTSGGGTSTYIKHINKHCKSYKPTDELQKVLGNSGPSGDVKNMLVAKGWSQEEAVEGIVEYIVLEEVPFSVVETEGFRRMMYKVQPRLHVPSRRTIVRDLFNMYDTMKDQLKKEIHNHRVSLTTDTWTSVQNLNYMVLVRVHLVEERE
ncbi:hypothetical protein ACFX1Z_005272 [Malus domestica]